MKKYTLMRDGARWSLTCESDGCLTFFDTKDDGVEGCAEYMRGHAGSLKIQGANGTIEEERTYPQTKFVRGCTLSPN